MWSEQADQQLNDTDKFLWDYILNEKWKEQNNDINKDVEREEEERSEEMEEFDERNNYCHEQPGGFELKTYPWVIEDSVWVKKPKWAK